MGRTPYKSAKQGGWALFHEWVLFRETTVIVYPQCMFQSAESLNFQYGQVGLIHTCHIDTCTCTHINTEHV